MKWEFLKIGEISDIIDGDRGKNYPKQSEYSSEGYCLFLNTGNVTQQGFNFSSNMFITEKKDQILRKGKLQRGDIVFTSRGTIGNTAYYNDSIPFENIRINSGMVILRAKLEKVEQKYLYQLLKSKFQRKRMQGYITGSAQPQLPIKNFSQVEIPVPPLAIQRRIADILFTYDDLIENNQKQIKLLEEATMRLYKEWLVDLRFPGYETTKIVNGVPDGWSGCKLADVIDFNPKVVFSKNKEKKTVPMSALSTDSMVVDETQISFTSSNSGSKFSNDDTLLARITPCLENGKTAFVDFLEEGEIAVGSTEFIVMRSKRLNPYMVYCIARSENFRGLAINSMAGADGRQRVKLDLIKDIKFLLPTEEIIELCHKSMEPLFKKIKVLRKQNLLLSQSRDKLLPKLMSGEMEV